MTTDQDVGGNAPQAMLCAQIIYPTEDFYWHFQDGDVFSARRYWLRLPANDPGYLAFLAAGNPRRAVPRDAAGADSLEILQTQILDHYGLHASLAHYAGGVRYGIEVQGVSVTIGGKAVPMATDRASRDGARDTLIAIMAGLRQDGAAFKFADGVSRSATNDEMKAAIAKAFGHVQAAYDTEKAIVEAIEAGTLKVPADVDAAFADAA